MRIAEQIVRRLGGHALLLTKKDKPLYHAACVLCSSGLTVLLHTAASFIENAAGKGRAVEVLWPLAQRTLHNVKEIGAAGALTGPIVRGDVGTVLEHLKAIPKKGESRHLYKSISLISLETGAGIEKLPHKKIKALKRLLEEK